MQSLSKNLVLFSRVGNLEGIAFFNPHEEEDFIPMRK
jgi:hypothetical protein